MPPVGDVLGRDKQRLARRRLEIDEIPRNGLRVPPGKARVPGEERRPCQQEPQDGKDDAPPRACPTRASHGTDPFGAPPVTPTTYFTGTFARFRSM